ncbi:MAG TPA: ACP S-malonyltransferase [Candidatus Marinimicrobia bacterium]|jgi:[acyl-carrier-protein] S-malonyltransferase|nr:ACP S-malonyltransferase [Candidatus Neomarinimicrobiota bacterium]|tara:strand:+ start:586 stop:1506 length:921 start_codon:yes stop_codon:yes gene_type:complete
MKSAWLFPGQASQYVGMGKDIFDHTDLGKHYFECANDIMECDIQSIIFNGPKEKLKQTQYTQPAIYIVSVILGELLKEKGFTPNAVAGHSLGEYSALAVANAFDFETGLSLVKVRAENMAKAGATQEGAMAAIIGIEDKTISELCSDYSGNGVVVAANYNSPGQVVISGSPEAVESVMDSAKASGARMTVQLNVSGAFHSPLMAPAREALAEMLDSLEISNSLFPVFTNVDAKPVIQGNDIKDSLIRQLENPVLWSKSIFSMKESGIESFVEVGPGKVLQGLNKRIDRKMLSQGVESLEQVKHFNV